jgi:hypothetical protein
MTQVDMSGGQLVFDESVGGCGNRKLGGCDKLEADLQRYINSAGRCGQ